MSGEVVLYFLLIDKKIAYFTESPFLTPRHPLKGDFSAEKL